MRTVSARPSTCTSKRTPSAPPGPAPRHHPRTPVVQQPTTHTRACSLPALPTLPLLERSSVPIVPPHLRLLSHLPFTHLPTVLRRPCPRVGPSFHLTYPRRPLVARVREHAHVRRPLRLHAHAYYLLPRPPSNSPTFTGTHPAIARVPARRTHPHIRRK